MAERNRVLYQSEYVFVGPPNGDKDSLGAAAYSKLVSPLHRIQEFSHGMEVNRTDVFEFGRLAALSREIIEAPTVTADMTYLLADGYNESGIGFTVCSPSNDLASENEWRHGKFPSAISGLLTDNDGDDHNEKNYYLVTSPEFTDVNDDANVEIADMTRSVVGIGNATVSNYSVNAAVGDFASASVSLEAFNVNFVSGRANDTAGVLLEGYPSPDVNKTTAGASTDEFYLPDPGTGNLSVFAIRPGDISIVFGTGADGDLARGDDTLQVGGAVLPGVDPDSATEDAGQTPMHIQSFSIEAPLTRTPLNRIGSVYPYARLVDFPQDITLNVSAFLADVTTGNLVDLMCNSNRTRTIDVYLKYPCDTHDHDKQQAGERYNMIYQLKNARLQSQNFSASIGDNKSVDLTFTAQYGGVTDLDNGLFISGAASRA